GGGLRTAHGRYRGGRERPARDRRPGRRGDTGGGRSLRRRPHRPGQPAPRGSGHPPVRRRDPPGPAPVGLPGDRRAPPWPLASAGRFGPGPGTGPDLTRTARVSRPPAARPPPPPPPAAALPPPPPP